MLSDLKLPYITNNYTQPQQAVLGEKEKTEGRSIAILGKQIIPYAQLKKIMSSCIAAEYYNIFLAILRQDTSNRVTGR